MAEDSAGNKKTRRVRGWIAALLTFFGLGLGLFYARRTKTAIWVAVFSVVASAPLAVVALALVHFSPGARKALMSVNDTDLITFPLGVALAIPFMIWAWLAAAKEPLVEKGSPLRLLGYVAVWGAPIAFASVCGFILHKTAFAAYKIPSASNEPTLLVGDRVLAVRISTAQARRGDMVTFERPEKPGEVYVKRVVGLPGDRIAFVGGIAVIDGIPAHTQKIGQMPAHDFEPKATTYREWLGPRAHSIALFDQGNDLRDTAEIKVPAGCVYLVGDNRDNSADSRIWGPIPLSAIRYKVDRIVIGALPGRDGARVQ